MHKPCKIQRKINTFVNKGATVVIGIILFSESLILLYINICHSEFQANKLSESGEDDANEGTCFSKVNGINI